MSGEQGWCDSQFRCGGELQHVTPVHVEHEEEHVLAISVQLDRRQFVSDVDVCQVLGRNVEVCSREPQ